MGGLQLKIFKLIITSRRVSFLGNLVCTIYIKLTAGLYARKLSYQYNILNICAFIYALCLYIQQTWEICFS